MRSIMMVVMMVGVARAEPTAYQAPMVEAASSPTAKTGKASVKGRVVLEDGKPATYFGVVIQTHGAPGYMSMPIAVRDAKGEFHFKGVEAGTWKVVVLGPGFIGAASGDLVLTDGKTTDAGKITVQLGNSLSGIVTDGGKPAAGARVCTEQRMGGMSFGDMTIDGKPLGERDLLDAKSGKQCATTDAKGHYVVRGIRDGIPPRFGNKTPLLEVTAELGSKRAASNNVFAKTMTRDLELK